MMYGCNKCIKICGWTFLVLGILFMLQDFGIWYFWNISWWTALFVVMGIGSLASVKCPDCQAIKSPKKK